MICFISLDLLNGQNPMISYIKSKIYAKITFELIFYSPYITEQNQFLKRIINENNLLRIGVDLSWLKSKTLYSVLKMKIAML